MIEALEPERRRNEEELSRQRLKRMREIHFLSCSPQYVWMISVWNGRTWCLSPLFKSSWKSPPLLCCKDLFIHRGLLCSSHSFLVHTRWNVLLINSHAQFSHAVLYCIRLLPVAVGLVVAASGSVEFTLVLVQVPQRVMCKQGWIRIRSADAPVV